MKMTISHKRTLLSCALFAQIFTATASFSMFGDENQAPKTPPCSRASKLRMDASPARPAKESAPAKTPTTPRRILRPLGNSMNPAQPCASNAHSATADAAMSEACSSGTFSPAHLSPLPPAPSPLPLFPDFAEVTEAQIAHQLHVVIEYLHTHFFENAHTLIPPHATLTQTALTHVLMLNWDAFQLETPQMLMNLAANPQVQQAFLNTLAFELQHNPHMLAELTQGHHAAHEQASEDEGASASAAPDTEDDSSLEASLQNLAYQSTELATTVLSVMTVWMLNNPADSVTEATEELLHRAFGSRSGFNFFM